ncbi:MAG: hypothetical protein ABFD08_10600 [Syntrophomonas sp.]
MERYKWRRLCLFVLAIIFLAVSAYFAYLHTYLVKTCYVDEKVVWGDQQVIVQKLEAYNFERDFYDYSNIWYFNIIEKLPFSLQMPFLSVCRFYSRPGITYRDTWEVNVQGIIIPGISQNDNQYLDFYIDGHLRGAGSNQPDNRNYTFFDVRGDYFTAEDMNQVIKIIFPNEKTAQKATLKVNPKWEKQYCFNKLPSNRGCDPADTVCKFFQLAAEGKKREALKLVAAENRNGFTWSLSAEKWNSLDLAGNQSFSLERLEKAGEYPVVYSLSVINRQQDINLTINLVKKQDSYEIIDIVEAQNAKKTK